MRSLFLVDGDFAVRERAMLRRMQVGLLDEGVRLIEALPFDAPDLDSNPLVPTLVYQLAGSRLTRAYRVRQIIQQLNDVDPPLAGETPDDLLDVVHVWGDAAWSVGAELARATGAAVAIECWSAASVRAIQSTERHTPNLRGAWLTPNRPLLDAAAGCASDWPVRLCRWGVHAHDWGRHIRRDAEPPSCAIIGGGHDANDFIPVLDAIRDVAEAFPELLAFIDASIVERRPAIWRHAEKIEILDRLSVIPDTEGQREIILQTDIMLFPEARGEARSILFDGLAAGLAVIARTDPLTTALMERDIAVLVEGGARGAWAEAIGRMLEDPAAAADLGARGRETILTERPVHTQVSSIIETHNFLTEDDSIAFPGGSDGS